MTNTPAEVHERRKGLQPRCDDESSTTRATTRRKRQYEDKMKTLTSSYTSTRSMGGAMQKPKKVSFSTFGNSPSLRRGRQARQPDGVLDRCGEQCSIRLCETRNGLHIRSCGGIMMMLMLMPVLSTQYGRILARARPCWLEGSGWEHHRLDVHIFSSSLKEVSYGEIHRVRMRSCGEIVLHLHVL
ncbi:uncharacterized protein B0I36DRAFT_310168 [Microdochium trichocladiopsis]|uniref:Uncharacterized protein n=1 Tax=Microdochium trichocladiopsis TaxID=1682393 RepID=A0A9P9BZK0_9PEZI|nr:uncharacterized protein B0I36DRAFT_310168 [Microdochium trichocladiopsis]KAH7040199.1 hypothetical protein B0I36DRAFT_310168 [Microdochium trichocladiopsis]